MCCLENNSPCPTTFFLTTYSSNRDAVEAVIVVRLECVELDVNHDR